MSSPFEIHLLPENASPLEREVSATARRVQLIPAPIDTVKQADTAPPAFLPFDAWEYSVDFYKPRWAETTKRVVVGSWFGDHRIKGTKRAIERYCEYAGSQLLRAITPPGKWFASPHWSKAEREAWLRSLPQVRVWNLKQRGARRRYLFAGAPTFNSFLDGYFPEQTEARFRLERRADLTLDGVTKAVDADGLGNQVDRVRIRGASRVGLFLGAVRSSQILVPSTASERIVTFTFAGQPAHGIRFPVRPGLEVKSVVPELIYEHGSAGLGVFFGGPLNGRYLVPTSAPLRIYSRIAIFDRMAVPPSRKALAFAGAGQLGVPPHTAELLVSIPGRRTRKAFGSFAMGCVVAADRERWNDTFVAIRAAKRLSDHLLVNSKTYRPMRVGSTLLIGGKLEIGRWTRS